MVSRIGDTETGGREGGAKRAGARRVAIGQMDAVCNDLEHNLAEMTRMARDAIDRGAMLIVFPELALTGYLVDGRFADAALRLDAGELKELRELSREIDICFGFIEETRSALFYNSAMYLSGGGVAHLHRKIYPPTYGPFDERRYFGAGWDVSAFETPVMRAATLVCGDAWHMPLAYLAAHDGADLLVILAASSIEGLTMATPSHEAWQWLCRTYALTLSCFVLFANQAGMQNGQHFWGGSFTVAPDGNVIGDHGGDSPELLVADLHPADIRRQRLRLPFRRDDSLTHTASLAQRILNAKAQREEVDIDRAIPLPPTPKLR